MNRSTGVVEKLSSSRWVVYPQGRRSPGGKSPMAACVRMLPITTTTILPAFTAVRVEGAEVADPAALEAAATCPMGAIALFDAVLARRLTGASSGISSRLGWPLVHGGPVAGPVLLL